jgi:xanthine/uracil permease
MEVQSLFRCAGGVLAAGILLMLLGVLVPQEWSVARLFRGVGVVVTLMGMVGMVAARQSATDGQQRSQANNAQSAADSQQHAA